MNQDGLLGTPGRGLQGRAANHSFEAEMNLKMNSNLDFDHEFIELEKQNLRIASFSSMLALLTCAATMSLSWVLFYRDVRQTYMWQGITEIGLILVAAVTVVWTRISLNTLEKGRSPSSLLTLLLFLSNALGFAYCIVTSLWQYFLRPLHYDYLIGLKMQPDNWNKIMNPEFTLQDGWDSSDMIFKANIACLVISGVCFLLVAFTTRTVDWSQFILLRYGLYASLACVVTSSFLILYWTAECKEYEKFMLGYPGHEVQMLWMVAMGGIAFAIVNGFVNVFRWRRGYFIMLFAASSLLCCGVASTGLVWRHVRQEQTVEQRIGSSSDCAITMSTIHENNLQDWCKQPKYLPQDQRCSKKFMVLRWEEKNQLRSLNPSCCLVAKHFYIYPHMCLAYWSSFLLLALNVTCLLNLGLCDQDDNLSQTSRLITWADIVGKLSVLLLVLGFGLYFYLRKPVQIQYGSKADVQKSFEYPDSIEIKGFTKVPSKVLNETNVELKYNTDQPDFSVCYLYSQTELYFPEGEVLKCGFGENSQCVLRVALGVQAAKILLINKPTEGYFQQVKDSSYSRVFFPFCSTSQIHDNLLLIGTASNIVKSLKSIKICPQRIYSTQRLFIYVDTVNLISDRLANGLLTTELQKISSFPMDPSKCGQEFGIARCAGESRCKQSVIPTYQMTLRTLKGSLYYFDNGIMRTKIPSTIKLSISDEQGSIPAEYSIFEDGIFAIKSLPVYARNLQMYKLAVEDSAGVFLKKEMGILIDGDNREDYPIGDIQLVTKQGIVCPFQDELCIKNQVTVTGDVVVIAMNGSSLAYGDTPVPKAKVSIYEGHTIRTKPIIASQTDINGRAIFKGLKYGSYAVMMTEDSSDYVINLIDLQEPRMNLAPLFLVPKSNDFEARIVGQILSSDVDLDMVVEMKSISGEICETSAFNKYCPYSAHQNDILAGPGDEVVIMKRLTVSTYNAFFRVSDPYPSTCTAQKVLDSFAYHFAQKLSWEDTSVETSPLSRMVRSKSTFRGSGSTSPLKKAYESFPKPSIASLRSRIPIVALLVNKNGIPVPAGVPLIESRNYLPRDSETDGTPVELDASKGLTSDALVEILDVDLPPSAILQKITSVNKSSSKTTSPSWTETDLQATVTGDGGVTYNIKRTIKATKYENLTVESKGVSESVRPGGGEYAFRRVNHTWTHWNGSQLRVVSDIFNLDIGEGSSSVSFDSNGSMFTYRNRTTRKSVKTNGTKENSEWNRETLKSMEWTNRSENGTTTWMHADGGKVVLGEWTKTEEGRGTLKERSTGQGGEKKVTNDRGALTSHEKWIYWKREDLINGNSKEDKDWKLRILDNSKILSKSNVSKSETFENRSKSIVWEYQETEQNKNTGDTQLLKKQIYKGIIYPNGDTYEYK